MSENTKALVAPSMEKDFKVVLAPEFVERRDEYLSEAGFVESVDNPEQLKEATNVVAKMKGFAKDVEKTRKEIKDPFLQAGKTIDLAAEKATAEIGKQIKRIETLMGDYQQAQMRKEREERLRREQEAQQEQARIAELQRQREEAERKLAEAKNAKARKAAEAELEAATDASIAAQIDANERQETTEPKAEKPRGMSARTLYVFEVEDIDALYAAQPQLVELTARTAAINSFINAPGASHDIPGLKITEKTRVAVRGVSANQTEFLD